MSLSVPAWRAPNTPASNQAYFSGITDGTLTAMAIMSSEAARSCRSPLRPSYMGTFHRIIGCLFLQDTCRCDVSDCARDDISVVSGDRAPGIFISHIATHHEGPGFRWNQCKTPCGGITASSRSSRETEVPLTVTLNQGLPGKGRGGKTRERIEHTAVHEVFQASARGDEFDTAEILPSCRPRSEKKEKYSGTSSENTMGTRVTVRYHPSGRIIATLTRHPATSSPRIRRREACLACCRTRSCGKTHRRGEHERDGTE